MAMDELKNIYEDLSRPGSYGSVESLYAEARKRGLQITRKEVKKWLSKMQSYTLHKPTRKRFKRNRTIVFYKDQTW